MRCELSGMRYKMMIIILLAVISFRHSHVLCVCVLIPLDIENTPRSKMAVISFHPMTYRMSFTGFLSHSVSHLIPAVHTISIHIPIHISIHNRRPKVRRFTNPTVNLMNLLEPRLQIDPRGALRAPFKGRAE